MINDFDFRGALKLIPKALAAAKKIADLKARARAADVPVAYVNDNFGRWRSDFRQQVEHCSREHAAGREVVSLLRPDRDDFFVLKPMHSGFYSTSLDVLLEQLGAERLILCGFAADICVLYTANDASMRGYDLAVPRDGVASETPERFKFALQHIERQLKADTRSLPRLQLIGESPDSTRRGIQTVWINRNLVLWNSQLFKTSTFTNSRISTARRNN